MDDAPVRMTNPYYDPGSQRGARVRDLFGSIARRYDVLNDLQSAGLHRFWKNRLAREASPYPGMRVLDLCSGTGDVARRLSARGAWVVGTDFSGPMLAVAANRSQARETSAAWVRADALHLPFLDEAFDAITISYGLRNVADRATALREMARVCRREGQLLILDFARPPGRPLRQLYDLYLRGVVPLFGRWFAGNADAYAYILESLRHYPDPEQLAGELTAAGWTSIRIDRLMGGMMTLHRACWPG